MSQTTGRREESGDDATATLEPTGDLVRASLVDATAASNATLAQELYGIPPATVAAWTLQGAGNSDWYDVSLVDGYNLPMRITNNVGCPVVDCAIDLGPNCPAALKGPYDSSGFPVGCKSSCNANLDGNQANSPNCCTGQHSTPETCPASGVAFYNYFKLNCPRAMAYAYDQASSTASWTCPSDKKADYTLTFCL